MRDNSGKALPVVLVVLAVLIVAGTVGAIFYVDHMQGQKLKDETSKIPYGVFIGVDTLTDTRLSLFEQYDMIVIEPDNFSKEEIARIKAAGVKVYGYINVGSADTTADYYENYSELALGPYDGWEDEVWIDVTDHAWAEYINARIDEIGAKGVDGFFVDNCDIYYYVTNGAGQDKADSGAVRESLMAMLGEMKRRYKPVIINGADTFVSYCIRNMPDVSKSFDAVNQESVFSTYDRETGQCTEALATAFYEAYLKKCSDAGLAVYLLEYSDSASMNRRIEEFCTENGYKYYISESYKLN